jgi:hypothetical protein
MFSNRIQSQCGLIIRVLYGSFDTCDLLEETSSKKADGTADLRDGQITLSSGIGIHKHLLRVFCARR